jgi:mRNA interferase RelE/StbE
MGYAVEFAPSAEREFRKLARNVQVRLRPRIDSLADTPRPPGAKKLAGARDLWRIRVGDYRIVYQVRDEILLVLVLGAAHRREVYR